MVDCTYFAYFLKIICNKFHYFLQNQPSQIYRTLHSKGTSINLAETSTIHSTSVVLPLPPAAVINFAGRHIAPSKARPTMTVRRSSSQQRLKMIRHARLGFIWKLKENGTLQSAPRFGPEIPGASHWYRRGGWQPNGWKFMLGNINYERLPTDDFWVTTVYDDSSRRMTTTATTENAFSWATHHLGYRHHRFERICNLVLLSSFYRGGLSFFRHHYIRLCLCLCCFASYFYIAV